MDNAHAGSALAPIHPKFVRHSSLGRCLPYSPSRVDMLYNPYHHVLLT